LGSELLRYFSSFILKDLKKTSTSVRLDEILIVILRILNDIGINCHFLFLPKNKDHVLYCLYNSYARNLSHMNRGRRSGLHLKPKILMYVNFSSNTHTPFPLQKIHGHFYDPDWLSPDEHGFSLLEKGILDMVEMKRALCFQNGGYQKWMGSCLKLTFPFGGHALECITIGYIHDWIRGHIEPLGLNESRQLMGDFVRN